MAPSNHVKRAFKAMNDLGIADAQVKPVLKNLLQLYDRNWELIAEDNYRALADAIFDSQDSQVTEEVKGKEKKANEAGASAAEVDRGKKKALESLEEDEDALDELEPPLKRLRRRGEGASALSLNNPSLKEHTTHDQETILLPFHPLSTENTIHGARNEDPRTTIVRYNEHRLATTLEESSTLELASSETGEVKINLRFSPATGGSSLHVPTMEELRRAMEDKCLRSYKILDPNFSVGRFMGDMVTCFLELSKNAASPLPEKLPFLTTSIDVLKKSPATMATKASNSANQSAENGEVGCGSMGLVVVPECQISADDFRLISSISDITLGKENVEIPWVNEFNSKVPPPFRYILQSYVYLDAAVKFSLGNIGDDDQRCSSCCGDCLAPSVACRCAGFAYTKDGLLQKDFLEDCIAEARDPQKHVLQYCKECPLEKAKNEETLEPCKGHLKRKVVKECWINCGCINNCGNRVVQHGIHNKLQVFFTPNGTGWGLRTLEKLPKGAFVCEFAGEILTISELIKRSSEKLTFPVILDAHWGSEEASGVDNALCLDGMHYGNISRFINHRCSDANLIDIPVHVENMDFKYYHLAFFTTRDIEAMEELTWDYGVEFNDHVYPTLPFHCQCGSEFCRNVKRTSKSKKAKKRA
ncbi:Histone-lysine N-methyltransferase SUVR2 [Raphanus sativus]|uniref:Probable inactive histone-lysine N-methyltransferase SUVR2 isoform X1 n=1 Tax=Raphanus sativus TaxID=3726 RepID=A0A9W3C1H5_RAPSA|nr:probable inactive histone-lysine N-methyltransferase SUVR2 isoform X1 [Raphanus sativus]KAJ4888768.1 Histone-lysine N-methyltransferase SUVR2 [Raphanus sativus]